MELGDIVNCKVMEAALSSGMYTQGKACYVHCTVVTLRDLSGQAVHC